MILTRRTKGLLLALAATVALAACGGDGGNGYGDTLYNNGNTGNTGPVALSALIKSLFASSTTDTALPVETNLIAIDTSSEDPADPNYVAILGM